MIDPREVATLQKLIALSGDQSAYVRLYRIYFAQLLRFARSFVRRVQDAEEIVQLTQDHLVAALSGSRA